MDARADVVVLPSNPDEDGATGILAATTFVVSLATVTVIARLYVRFLIIRNTGWDVRSNPSTTLLFVCSSTVSPQC